MNPTAMKTILQIEEAFDSPAIKNIFRYNYMFNVKNYSEFITKIPIKYSLQIHENKKASENIDVSCSLYYKTLLDVQFNRWNYLININCEGNPSHFESLLQIQGINCNEFVNDLKLWLMCSEFKKNTFFLFGPPNTGKTLIAKMLSQIFISKSFSNIDASSQFIFGNLINSSIILMEEPFLLPILIEDFKKICEGTEITVNVKFRTPQTLSRTPVFITSNFREVCHGHAPPISERAIKARSFYYEFINEVKFNCEITVFDFIQFIKKYNN